MKRHRARAYSLVGSKLFAICLSVPCVVGCGAVYPEIAPPIKASAPGRVLSPPPPEDLLYVVFEGAVIPNRTRDGRQWDAVGGDAPDAFAQLFVDDEEIIKTPVDGNTLKPTWPDQKRLNYRIKDDASIRVELWDANPINNRPICVKKLRHLLEESDDGVIDVRCDSGARVTLRVEPAHARLGLGFYYELRTVGVYVSRILTESPASRVGLRKGDEIVEIMGRRVVEMEKGEAQSLINSNAQTGVKMRVKGEDGGERAIQIKEGPIYPVVGEIPLA